MLTKPWNKTIFALTANKKGKTVESTMTASKEDLNKLVTLLDSMLQDNSIPRNVRANLALAKERLQKNDDIATGVSGAIYALDEVSNDINLPMHGRTMIWNLLSELEAMKDQEQ